MNTDANANAMQAAKVPEVGGSLAHVANSYIYFPFKMGRNNVRNAAR